MSGDGFTVQPEALRAAAGGQEAAAGVAESTARTVESATAQGNLFGVIGQMAGMDAGYRGWVADEVASLDGLARHLRDLADGLRANAEAYEHTDSGNAEHLASRYRERS
ncbi:type VII secretion target [Micromonospora sp. CPCC 205711]|uniref:type VII secretion target n=1 Tax=Micromonospora sp. CPCC 205547 TaxID=3122400 RepID=UPI002FEEC331